jgi:glycosyltransferase involved in cell wall biosynthesis
MKISIITACYNAEKTIKKTIKSVINQSYSNIEYIIIDGASYDQTLSIITPYKANITHLISEPDNGVYEAMNKGIKLATGDYISILNADDFLVPNVINRLVDTIKSNPADFYCGTVFQVDALGQNVGRISPLPKVDWKAKSIYEMPWPHISLFCKKEIFTQLNNFDESYKIAGDHHFSMKLAQSSLNGYLYDFSIGQITVGGISENSKALNESFRVAYSAGAPLYNCVAKLLRYKTIYFIKTNIPLWLFQKLLPKNSRYKISQNNPS